MSVARPGPGATAPGLDPASADGPCAADVAEIWVIPAHDPKMDGTLTARACGDVTTLGSGTDVAPVSLAAPGSVAATRFDSATGRSSVVGVDSGRRFDYPLTGAVRPAVLLDPAHIAFQDHDEIIVKAVAGGATVATHPLASLAPDPLAGKRPRGYKGLYMGAGVGSATAILTVDGDLIAVTSTGRAAAVTDLSTGHTTNLDGFGQTGPAVVGADGAVYVTVWQRYNPSATVHVVRLAPGSLAMEQSFDTQVSTDTMRNVDLVATTAGPALFLFHGDADALHATAFTVTASGLRDVPALPDGIGLDASADGDGGVYLFGGPAGNRVSTVDLSTGVVAAVPAMRAPAGAYVVAVGRS